MPSDQISPVKWKPEFIDPLSRNASLFSRKNQGTEDDFDSEWEPDSDSDDCSELELDDDGNVFDAFGDGLWFDDGLWLLQLRKINSRENSKYGRFSKINTREKSKFLQFAKINTSEIHFFFDSRK